MSAIAEAIRYRRMAIQAALDGRKEDAEQLREWAEQAEADAKSEAREENDDF